VKIKRKEKCITKTKEPDVTWSLMSQFRHMPQLLQTLPAVGKSLSHKPDTAYMKTDRHTVLWSWQTDKHELQAVHGLYLNRVTAAGDTQNQKLARSSTSDRAPSLNFRAAQLGGPSIRKVALRGAPAVPKSTDALHLTHSSLPSVHDTVTHLRGSNSQICL
jgi:hypothetical protein